MRYNDDVDHAGLIHIHRIYSQRVTQHVLHFINREVICRIGAVRVRIDILGLGRTEVNELFALDSQRSQGSISRFHEVEDDRIDSLVFFVRSCYRDIDLDIAVRQVVHRGIGCLLLLVELRLN